MGYVTTVLIHNDRLSDIKNDPKFGDKLDSAILEHHMRPRENVYVNPGATIIGQNHSTTAAVFITGGNTGLQAFAVHADNLRITDPEDRLRLLRMMADEAGFKLIKKPQKHYRKRKPRRKI